MDETDVIAALCRLEEMDRGAVGLYRDAIGKTSDQTVRRQLEQFRKDHERHAEAIGGVLQAEGLRQVDVTPEFRSLMDALRRQVDMAEGGDDAVMVAMDLGEKTTNAEYAEALRMHIHPRVKQVLEGVLADERRHLAYIEEHLPPSFGGGVGRRRSGHARHEAGLPGGLDSDVREGVESKGSPMAGGRTGEHEEHPNLGGQVEGDSGSSGSGVAGSGSGD